MASDREAEVVAVHPGNAAHRVGRVVLRVAPVERLIVNDQRLAYPAVNPDAKVARTSARARRRAPGMRKMIAKTRLDLAEGTRARVPHLRTPRGEDVEHIVVVRSCDRQSQVIGIRKTRRGREAELVAPPRRVHLADELMKGSLH